MATIRADKLNPHDVIVIDGERLKVMAATRFGYPVTAVSLTLRDATKPKARKTLLGGVPADREFEYLGDSRLMKAAAV